MCLLRNFVVLQCSTSEMDTTVAMGLYTGFLYIIASSSALAKLMSDFTELENNISTRLKEACEGLQLLRNCCPCLG